MSQVIHCPSCNKKFRLGANVPATFTCTSCGTLMDLSDFGGQEPAPAPAAPSRGGAPQSRRSRARGGGGGSPAPSRSRGGRGGAPSRSRRGGRGRAAPQEDYYEDEAPRGYRGRQQKSNAPLIIGSVAALMVAVILVVIKMKGDDEGPPPADPSKTKKTASSGANPGASNPTPAAAGTPAAANNAAPAGNTPAPAAGNTPAPAAGTAPAPAAGEVTAPKKPRKTRIISGKTDLQVFEWPEDIDAETRAKAEEGIKAMYAGGRDWTDAQDWFIEQGHKLCGRLISEFKTISDSPGFEDRLGRSYASAIDATLRKIDGWMERKQKQRDPIRASSSPTFVKKIAKKWTWWWKNDVWVDDPEKIWDPFEDEDDSSPTGIKKPKKKKKGGGFGKRAGG